MQFKAIVSFIVLGLASVAIASPSTNEQRGAEKADFEKVGDAY